MQCQAKKPKLKGTYRFPGKDRRLAHRGKIEPAPQHLPLSFPRAGPPQRTLREEGQMLRGPATEASGTVFCPLAVGFLSDNSEFLTQSQF